MTYRDIGFDEWRQQDQNSLADRVVNGEVFLLRGALQHFGLYQLWHDATIRGITKSVGKEAADRAERDGFHRIHEWVSAADIPAMTEAVYAEVEPTAQTFLDTFMTGAFPTLTSFYYERTPNVRFHIPFDIAQAHKKSFSKFAKDHGSGKIAAHGPHRDSWLDCPSNGMNLWFAMGRIKPGNGLTVYSGDYNGDHVYQLSGDIADGQKLHKTDTFDMMPGDVVIFHTDHVHGSELNRLDETRFAISCRLSVDRPIFPKLHFHDYVHSSWNRSSLLRPVASVPAKMQSSYITSLAARVRNKLVPALGPKEPEAPASEAIGTRDGDIINVALADVPVGEIRGVSGAICVARMSEDRAVALSRRCPHAGGDIANGWIDGDAVVCPWHNLPFSTKDGASSCSSLSKLRILQCDIEGDQIRIDVKKVLNTVDADDDAAVENAMATGT